MSFTIHGIGVSGGIAIGHAQLMTHAGLDVPRYAVPPHQAADESARFEAAVKQVRTEFEELRASVPATAPAEFAAFINLHLMILNDSTLSVAPRRIIETENCNAEWALRIQADALLAQFDEIEDEYLRERRADVIQVAERVMKTLSGQPGYVPPPRSDAAQSLILVAHDLSPADVVQFKQHRFASFITDLGGTTSHTAVVARSLAIPSIVALHRARQLIRENDLVIVDGTQGVVIVGPDEQVLAEYQLRQHQFDLERQKLRRLRDRRAVTLDGVAVELQANIEQPADVVDARDNGATGIGLYRSEFLFLNRDDLPDEDEQFEAYRKVAVEMDGMPVTIRTYDLGADKDDVQERVTTNPALGLRAIRLCLTEPRRFITQLRAMLRASHYGKINILIPMLATAAEIEQTLALIQQAKQSLDDEGVSYDRGIKVGGMIEVPAAALALGIFVRKLDFLSIGTNDLIQYTLAIDRTDDTVAHLYDPLHPAVLNLIAGIIATANKAKVPVALCGEMAGDTALTRLLLAFGLRQYSMHIAHLLDVKQIILKSDYARLKPLARKMLRATDPAKLLALLEKLNSA
ncbi:MAG: phosphoenolpyruvate--protein phosphotransferase [Betaproteobacteria bacterium RIFCSPLOWO2_02_FULL_67_26]|nr:MAG: phosphoenolpyruvate--protein phosphotransferase [Betaproteobacteria bacterium RIFCSPLOWO2_02_FULL_67_26]